MREGNEADELGFLSVLSHAHKLVAERMQRGESAIDATAGNGVDTLFLARLAGPKGAVHAFDVQREALTLTAARLAASAEPLADVQLHLRSHAEMAEALPEPLHGKVAAIMFNLGYLPGQDQTVITRADSTVAALNAALRLLRRGGVVTIVLYTGHPGGDAEAAAVEAWAEALPQAAYQTMATRFLNQRRAAPYLIAVEKRQSD